MIETVKLIDKYTETYPKAKILIAVNAYWPLPFYLEKYSGRLAYLQTDKVADYINEYDVIIADKNNEWRDPNWKIFYNRLSDVQESYTYFKNYPK